MMMVRVLVMMMHKKMAVMIWMAHKTTVIAILMQIHSTCSSYDLILKLMPKKTAHQFQW